MRKGGYAIIDLQDVSLVDSATTATKITGTYKTALAALQNRRAVLLSGITLQAAPAKEGDDPGEPVQYPDCFGSAWQETATQISIRSAAGGKVLLVHVTNTDGVIAELG